MERGVEGVVETERQRWVESVEEETPAMSTWRETGASSTFYSGSCILSYCQVTVGWGLDEMPTVLVFVCQRLC